VKQYAYTPWGQVQDKQLSLTIGGMSGYLEAYFAYNGYGEPAVVQGPWSTDTEFFNANYLLSYSYDGLGRPVAMTYRQASGYAAVTQIDGTSYGAAGNLLSLTYTANGYSETRSYDGMYRLTGIAGSGGGLPSINLTYRYPVNNGGRIDQMTEQTDTGVNTVTYQYDRLRRLAAAQSAGPDVWGLSFSYDGFGNRKGRR
jgi:hypothetical protein